jgi:glycerol uptake facilitator-like aquaporin
MVNKKIAAMVVGEFLGAAFLTTVVLSVRGSAIGIPYFVALAAGLTFGMMLLSIRGWNVQMNPAITVGLWTIRQIKTAHAVVNIGAQLLGGYLAYLLFTYFVNNKLTNIAGHYEARIMLAEAVGALVFSFAVAAAVYNEYRGLKLAAAGGLALTLGIIVASAASNGLVNPALALGVRSWSWGTYVLGPVVGSVVGMNIYSLLFADNGGFALSSMVSRPSTTTVVAKRSSTKSKSKKKK